MKLKLVLDSLDGLDEATQKLYAKAADGKFHLDVDGIPDVDKLTKALRTEREQREEAERKARAFDGLDAEEVRRVLQIFEGNEEAKLIKEGKFDEVINRRLEKAKAEWERQLNAAKDAAKRAEEKATKWTQRVLDNHVREAAAKVSLHPTAIEDALFRARAMFSLDDEGNAVQLVDGKPALGKDGKSPFSPAEWLEGMKEKAPHWFPATGSGGGASSTSTTGAAGSKDGRKTYTRAQYEAMTPDQRATVGRERALITD